MWLRVQTLARFAAGTIAMLILSTAGAVAQTEAAKTEIVLKPCQNLVDLQLR